MSQVQCCSTSLCNNIGRTASSSLEEESCRMSNDNDKEEVDIGNVAGCNILANAVSDDAAATNAAV